MVDQKTIAERAGVSPATVSRAFTQNANVSPKTLAKIQTAMESLGVQPLYALPGESRKKNRYVLIIAGDISNAFFSQVIKGICDRLLILGLLPVVCNSNDNSQIEESQVEMADANRFLGIIIVTAMERPTLSAVLQRVRIPVVFVNRYMYSFTSDTVCIDNYQGGYMAAMHLMEKGHTRIAHIASHRNVSPQKDRVKGFMAALRERQPFNDHYQVFYGKATLERGCQLAEDLVRQGMPYTALFVADCQIAIGIVNTMKELGYNIPRDLSILCFDDSPYINEFGLRLSTVAYDPYAMGQSAVELLMQRLDDPSGSAAHINLVPRLVCRGSICDV